MYFYCNLCEGDDDSSKKLLTEYTKWKCIQIAISQSDKYE